MWNTEVGGSGSLDRHFRLPSGCVVLNDGHLLHFSILKEGCICIDCADAEIQPRPSPVETLWQLEVGLS
jgi:hypothetical protein